MLGCRKDIDRKVFRVMSFIYIRKLKLIIITDYEIKTIVLMLT